MTTSRPSKRAQFICRKHSSDLIVLAIKKVPQNLDKARVTRRLQHSARMNMSYEQRFRFSRLNGGYQQSGREEKLRIYMTFSPFANASSPCIVRVRHNIATNQQIIIACRLFCANTPLWSSSQHENKARR